MPTIKLPFRVPGIMLACGADLKGAFAIARGRSAILETGFGDLADLDDSLAYEKAVRRSLGRAKPETIVCDLHPGYFSTRFAGRLQRATAGSHLVQVQHHEAHIASAITDHNISGDVIGVAFDGTGYGSDGMVWGGEFFAGNAKRLIRVGHLAYLPMPGGEMAVREPGRMAAAYLYRAFGERWTTLKIDMARGADKAQWRLLKRLIDRGAYAPLTSSAGRLFDAAGSIILARYRASGEAELPVALERLAAEGWADAYDCELRRAGGMFVVDVTKTIKGIVADLLRKVDTAIVAGRFHNTVAEIIVKTCTAVREKRRIDTVVLSGGVFRNRIVSDRALFLLGIAGFKVYQHARVETTDAGIPIGQIAIAAARPVCA